MDLFMGPFPGQRQLSRVDEPLHGPAPLIQIDNRLRRHFHHVFEGLLIDPGDVWRQHDIRLREQRRADRRFTQGTNAQLVKAINSVELAIEASGTALRRLGFVTFG